MLDTKERSLLLFGGRRLKMAHSICPNRRQLKLSVRITNFQKPSSITSIVMTEGIQFMIMEIITITLIEFFKIYLVNKYSMIKQATSLLNSIRKFSSLKPFHLAIPVNNIQNSMKFYGQIMGCTQGRKCKYNVWVDYNFYGHQLVCHYVSKDYKPHEHCNDVDKQAVPVPHFGICLGVEQWKNLRDRLVKVGTKFVVEPQLRFEGQKGQQWTMFFKDPSGNSLQFKAMTNPQNLFAKYQVE